MTIADLQRLRDLADLLVAGVTQTYTSGINCDSLPTADCCRFAEMVSSIGAEMLEILGRDA
jgi:hypothetical protein